MTRIQKRRGTAAEWAAANPVLAEGEDGYESDTGRTKIGNGEDQWSDLFYSDTTCPVLADGVTDVSTALGSLIAGLPDASVLQLGEGIYYVPELRNVSVSGRITIKGIPGKTILKGDGTLATNLWGVDGASADTMLHPQPGASIRVEDVIFEDAGILLGLEELAEYGDIELIRCDFTNCGGPVMMLSGGATTFLSRMSTKTLTFRNFRMVDCNVRSCELGANIATQGGWESATITGCNFHDVGMMGVWIGSEGAISGAQARDPLVFQPVQSSVHVYGNTFRQIRLTGYTNDLSSATVNAIVVMGQAVSIYGNYIEDLDIAGLAKWDDCEGIYTKARWSDIHDNILINAGGNEAAIMLKGGGWQASTTLDSSMNGLTLPQATLTVASTAGFPSSGDSSVCSAIVMTDAGWQHITYTGKTSTTLTGVSGGTGTLSTGGTVEGEAHISGYPVGVVESSRCHDNVIIFTRTDRKQCGIGCGVPKVEVTDNIIKGATGPAIFTWPHRDNGLIARNRIVDHHSGYIFLVVADGWVYDDNTIVNFDGTYGTNTELRVFWVVPADGQTLNGVEIRNNRVRQPLTEAGALSTATSKTYVVRATGNGTCSITDLVIAGNSARNVAHGISLQTSTVTVTNVTDVDNDFRNDTGSPPDGTLGSATVYLQRPILDVVTLTGTQALTNKTLTGPTITGPKFGASGIFYDTNSKVLAQMQADGSAVNYLIFKARNAGSSPSIAAWGSDTDLDVTFTPRGAGHMRVYASTGNTPTVKADGADTDHNLNLITKGAGVVQANGIELVCRTIQTVTGAVNLGATGDYIVLIGAGGAPTLPTAVGNRGVYRLKNTDTASHTIATTSSQTVEGDTPYILSAGASIDIVSDGTNWRIV